MNIEYKWTKKSSFVVIMTRIFYVILLTFQLFICRNSSDRIEKNCLEVEKTDCCIQQPQDSTDIVVKAEDLTEDPSKDMPGSDAVEIAEGSPKIESKNDTAPRDSSSATFESKRLRSKSPQIGRHSRSPAHERSHDQKPLSDDPLRSSQSSPSRSSQRERVESRAKTDHRSDSRRTSSRESSRNRRSPSHRSSSSKRASSSTNRTGNSGRSAIPKNKDDHKSFHSEKSPKKAVAIVPPRKRSPVE